MHMYALLLLEKAVGTDSCCRNGSLQVHILFTILEGNQIHGFVLNTQAPSHGVLHFLWEFSWKILFPYHGKELPRLGRHLGVSPIRNRYSRPMCWNNVTWSLVLHKQTSPTGFGWGSTWWSVQLRMKSLTPKLSAIKTQMRTQPSGLRNI